MSRVDLELKKAFAELQEKAIETSQKLRLSDIQIESLHETKQHASTTEKELSALDGNSKMYETIGRMFILTPPDEIKTILRKRQEEADEKIKKIEDKKAYLEQKLKEAENNIREMLQQRK